MRCALCHAELEPSVARTCPGCGTLLHAECRAGLGRCPSLGCGAAPPDRETSARGCGAAVASGAIECSSCLVEVVDAEPASRLLHAGRVLATMAACAVAGFCLLVLIVQPGGPEARKPGNELAALAKLRELAAAQVAFRDEDRDRDAVVDFATLGELALASDDDVARSFVAAVGTDAYVHGYRLVMSHDADVQTWAATAYPSSPGLTGDRYFGVDATGVVLESASPFRVERGALIAPADHRPAPR